MLGSLVIPSKNRIIPRGGTLRAEFVQDWALRTAMASAAAVGRKVNAYGHLLLPPPIDYGSRSHVVERLRIAGQGARFELEGRAALLIEPPVGLHGIAAQHFDVAKLRPARTACLDERLRLGSRERGEDALSCVDPAGGRIDRQQLCFVSSPSVRVCRILCNIRRGLLISAYNPGNAAQRSEGLRTRPIRSEALD